jgi:hypothetical protein
MDPSGAMVPPWEIDLSTSPELTIVSTELALPASAAA